VYVCGGRDGAVRNPNLMDAVPVVRAGTKSLFLPTHSHHDIKVKTEKKRLISHPLTLLSHD
jgi:hypothetical protein